MGWIWRFNGNLFNRVLAGEKMKMDYGTESLNALWTKFRASIIWESILYVIKDLKNHGNHVCNSGYCFAFIIKNVCQNQFNKYKLKQVSRYNFPFFRVGPSKSGMEIRKRCNEMKTLTMGFGWKMFFIFHLFLFSKNSFYSYFCLILKMP